MMKTRTLIITTAIAAVMFAAPASAQILRGGGSVGGAVGGTVNGATGSIGGNAGGSIGVDRSAVDGVTARAQQEARRAAREAREAARRERSVAADASASADGAVNAGPLSADGSASADGGANATVNPGETADGVTSRARSAAQRVRGAADRTTDRLRSARPNASVEGEANAGGGGSVSGGDSSERNPD